LDVAAHRKGDRVSSTVQVAPPQTRLATLPIDQRRGMDGMWAVIATEFMLFVCMFGSYYYLGVNKNRWAIDEPPVITYALVLLVILLSSSFVLHWGERQVIALRFGAARFALWITVGIGLVFLTIQSFEYISHWKKLAPYSDSYGSIFYAITTLHAAHVIVGLLMLAFVGVLPRFGETRRSPHNAYRTVSLYWHFVDFVWILIVLMLYVIPNFQGSHHVR
jgi:heme/copper-type cytochrome/quinol oxidase subunit 3